MILLLLTGVPAPSGLAAAGISSQATTIEAHAQTSTTEASSQATTTEASSAVR